MQNKIYTYNVDELKEILANLGEPTYRAKQLYEWLHVHNARSYDEMTNLPKSLRENLSHKYPLSKTSIIKKEISKDGTRKYLIQLEDGLAIETVGIPAFQHSSDVGSITDPERITVCFSTQVGCPMACEFCATGKEGFKRNLTSQEIIDQVNIVQQDFKKRISNIVAMGQGEPFLNYDNLLTALRRINSDEGFKIGARHITVSTCGLIDGINRFSLEPEQFTLAISLHSAIQSKRNLIMPKMENQHITKLRRALEKYIMERNRRVTFEYLMIDCFNDTNEDLEALISFCDGLLCHVNLIPFNSIEDSQFKSSSDITINKWISTLNGKHISTTLRNSKGSDISGACGQLKRTSII